MLQERKRQEILALEKQLDEEYRLQASLAAQAAANKKELLNFISQVCFKSLLLVESLNLVHNYER